VSALLEFTTSENRAGFLLSNGCSRHEVEVEDMRKDEKINRQQNNEAIVYQRKSSWNYQLSYLH
jgi:hypothetical protein